MGRGIVQGLWKTSIDISFVESNTMDHPKFRAFHIPTKKMYYDVIVYPNGISFGPYAGKFYFDKDQKIFVLMQTNGLQDINGKNIYVGDIVKNAQGQTFEVKQFPSGFYFVDREKRSEPDTHIAEKMQIIGNIYEHA